MRTLDLLRLSALGLLVALGAWGLSQVISIHSPIFALLLQVMLMGWALYLLELIQPTLNGSFFTVRTWEVPLYRALGSV